MQDILILIDYLKKLENELGGSGKSETADFFNNLILRLSHSDDDCVLRELLEQICRSGAMSQYVGFTYKEDQLFKQCYDEAKKLLTKT